MSGDRASEVKAPETDEEVMDTDSDEERGGCSPGAALPIARIRPYSTQEMISPASMSQPCSAATVGAINIEKSTGVHIGPKIVHVVQNVDNAEKVKDLSCPRYLLHIIKNTSRAERYACALVSLLLVICTGVAVVLYVLHIYEHTTDNQNEGPDSWYIKRAEWLAEAPGPMNSTEGFQPLPLVIINHSTGAPCFTFNDCAAELRNLQSYFQHQKNYSDLPYNYLIGNDGRVYEGRGWNNIGAHTYNYNLCSLGIGYIGDYRPTAGALESKFSQKQIDNTFKLLDMGIKSGQLRSDYVILGHRDLRTSESPGENIYNVIKKWPNYDKDRYWKMNCSEIKLINEAKEVK